jgi:hypothetical protein
MNLLAGLQFITAAISHRLHARAAAGVGHCFTFGAA